MSGVTEILIAMNHATYAQTKDPDFMFKYISNAKDEEKETVSEEVMKHAHPDLKNNPAFMFAVTERNPRAVRCIGIFLKSNPAFILKANEITPIARECYRCLFEKQSSFYVRID